MFKMHSILARSLVALALVAGAGAAFAAPVYHVTIDTAKLSTGPAYLDFVYGGLDNAAASNATLSAFSGNFGTDSERAGASTGSISSGQVVLGNSSGYNDLFQSIVLGGLFSFDVSFTTMGGGAGSRFSASLYDADQNSYAGVPDNLVMIDIIPGQDDVVAPANGFGSVSVAAANDVPEPSALLSMVSGLGLLGFSLRRRMR